MKGRRLSSTAIGVLTFVGLGTGLYLSVGSADSQTAAPPAPTGASQTAPVTVDETALRYFARQGDTQRLQAEIARLKSLYPNWTPPADPSAFPAPSDAQLDRLWQLYSEGKYAEARQAIAERQQQQSGWQPPADLVTRLDTADARQRLINASDLEQNETVVRLGAENPELLTCGDVDVLWRVAKAFAGTGRDSRAVDAFRYILTNCENPQERAATVQMALPLLSEQELNQLLTLERTGPDGVGEFTAIRGDIVRQKIASGGADSDVNATPADIALLEKLAEEADTDTDPLLLGWYFFQHDDFSDARKWFELAGQRNSTDEAARGLSLSLIGLRQFVEAEATMRPYSSLSPQDRAVYLAASANLLATEPPVFLEAPVLANMVKEVAEAKDAATAEQLGWYSYALNQFQTAGQWFSTSLEWRPDGELAAFGLALTYQRLGNQAGLTAIQRAWAGRSERIANIGTDWSEAQPASSTPVAPTPPPASPALSYAPAPVAAAPAATPDPAPAPAPAARQTRAAPTGNTGNAGCQTFIPPESLAARPALNRGWCLMRANRPMEAAPAFDVALKTTADASIRQDAAYGLTLAYLRLGLVDRASAAASQAPQPQNRRLELESAILSQRATGFFDADRPVETLMVLDQRNRIVPEPIDLMVLRGYSYMKLRRYPEARQIFRAIAAVGNREGVRGLAAVNEAMNPTPQ
ncbi:tetratricopeptide repeat protein [Aureimonas fodinaquatilis]|uniref:Tetratricopeptide repeat protein n=1 Tax=Aureimonas fodinaquatilis TaxID=2565783 RepID=A0A5B0DR23_9HYPH|nr:tetratricopeptide repeat protein [Aureimonas fodinaquatilis]KAA0968442.1 tetratricopeptide repeat protein [Aureimonas fodinaquatilis]